MVSIPRTPEPTERMRARESGCPRGSGAEPGHPKGERLMLRKPALVTFFLGLSLAAQDPPAASPYADEVQKIAHSTNLNLTLVESESFAFATTKGPGEVQAVVDAG